ncbi:hypothetical protein [Roseomonas sp. BN140053]|uniref:hypothetical protein n=1 Tax=Roseomonas sp. BN140053 TaxID=3391898 RepID=UPI0039EC81D7
MPNPLRLLLTLAVLAVPVVITAAPDAQARTRSHLVSANAADASQAQQRPTARRHATRQVQAQPRARHHRATRPAAPVTPQTDG